MRTIHLEEKKKLLTEKREKLIGRFNDAVRVRKNTAVGRSNRPAPTNIQADGLFSEAAIF
jgi:hypothetical protein